MPCWAIYCCRRSAKRVVAGVAAFLAAADLAVDLVVAAVDFGGAGVALAARAAARVLAGVAVAARVLAGVGAAVASCRARRAGRKKRNSLSMAALGRRLSEYVRRCCRLAIDFGGAREAIDFDCEREKNDRERCQQVDGADGRQAPGAQRRVACFRKDRHRQRD